ncbi:histidine kinase N-terminal 7TM domain-containing protein [Halapricum desulfuricans]|uniref:histidine kinase n=1 Tax=Halapricum desulfuricans TaxID=2841257 RepID=A0A897NSH2_9EURY|nr:histidine kinase N-terminal 7TM domain-containing protein [Halapricum desulfuricans]QSG15758.1 Signal transduction histidine kinase, contains PAS domain [Halapricum desulfuricans]
MVSSLYVPLMLLAAVAGSGLAVFAWLHRDTPGAAPLALFLLAASLWSLTDALSIASDAPVFWTALKLSISTLVPLSWLALVFEYTGRERWLSGPRLLALVVEPIVFSALIWTNGSHGLVWRSSQVVLSGQYYVLDAVPGLAFWGNQAYAYGLIAAGAALLVGVLWRTDGIFRDQSTALLIAIVVPMVVNALYVFGYIPGAIDPTGIAFVFSGAVIAAAILREHLLDVTPATRQLGREELIGQLDDPVIIVDAGGTIVDLNRAAESLLAASAADAIGSDLAALAPKLADLDGVAEITMDRDGMRCYYDVRVSELDRAYGTVTGRIISLRDVTERTRREQRLDVMNRLYRHNLRNEMNVVRGHAELLATRVETPEHREHASTIIDTANDVIDRSEKISALSRSVADEPTQSLDLCSILQSLAASARADNPAASITLDSPGSCVVVGDPSIEIAIEELLANAIEHAERPDPTVRLDLTVDDGRARLAVADDGPGIPEQELEVLDAGTETPMEHASGVGLWLVTWAIERVGGTVAFETGDSGTTVTVTLRRGDSRP